MSWPFLLTSLVVVATPGTGAVYTLNAGLLRGHRAAAWAAAACTLGTVPHLLAAVSGLAALLHAASAVHQVLVWAGVAYLLHMTWTTWRSVTVETATGTGGLPVPGHRVPAPAGPAGVAAPPLRAGAVAVTVPAPRASRVLRDGVVLNLLNPKLTIFFIAFLPQFLTTAQPVRAAVQMSVLGAVFTGLTWVVFTAYGVGAALLRPVLVRRPALLARVTRSFAVCYLVLAVGLAVQHLR
ncbi:LysE family translocator [Kineococcus sp. SYSU DK004]|uniref:LysE family translocator n=1 Tax=Kineococcus sp. SYSU DK004 TaxID=3383125 RepID=UPI003D7E0054